MPKINKEYWYIVIAGILSGLLVFGGKVFSNLGLSLFQISVLPLLFQILILLPFVVFKKEYRLKKEMIWFLVVYGLVGFFALITEFGGVVLGVPVAIAVLLMYVQPLWTIIISRIFLKEKITKNRAVAIFLVLSGTAALVNPFSVQKIGTPVGLIFAFLSGFGLSAWVILGRVYGKRGYQPVTIMFSYALFALTFLLLAYPVANLLTKEQTIINFSLGLPIEIWFYLFLFALFGRMIAHLLYYKGVQKVEASDAGVILLLEPISGAILAAIFLSQPLTANIIMGGGLDLGRKLSSYQKE